MAAEEVCYENLERFYKEKNSNKQAILIREILKARRHLPGTSTLAMRVKADKNAQIRLNHLISSLLLINFEVKLFPSVKDPTTVFYILLNFS
jgi:hypothetical protein